MSQPIIEPCENCNIESQHFDESYCRACFYPRSLNPINVKFAKSNSRALNQNYHKLRNNIKASGKEILGKSTLNRIQNSNVIIATSSAILAFMANDPKYFYQNSYSSKEKYLRANGLIDNDKKRRMIDYLFYGGEAKEIYYGCLSTNGLGIENYGRVFLKLKTSAISHRSTVLIKNIYRYFEELESEGQKFDDMVVSFRQNGDKAIWEEREKLAFLKLSSSLMQKANDGEEIELFTNGNTRLEDELLEVHIFSSFNIQAIESVACIPETEGDEMFLQGLKGLLDNYQIDMELIK